MTSMSPLTQSIFATAMRERGGVGQPHFGTVDDLIKEGFVLKDKIPTIDEIEAKRATAALLKADDVPENVWGTITVGGKIMAEIYKTGIVGYFGDGGITVNTDAPLDDILKQITNQIGGAFEAGPAYESYNAASAFSDAKTMLQMNFRLKNESFLFE